MDTAIMRGMGAIALLALLALNGCAGYQTGKGLNGLDTISAEDKAEQKWFDKFYGHKPAEGESESDGD